MEHMGIPIQYVSFSVCALIGMYMVCGLKCFFWEWEDDSIANNQHIFHDFSGGGSTTSHMCEEHC